MNVDRANQTAVERMMAAHPVLKTVARAGDVIPGLDAKRILHAGPPIEWRHMSGPLRGAVIGALLYEGLADSRENAIHLIECGEIAFCPATTTEPSGPWQASLRHRCRSTSSRTGGRHDRKAYSTLNEGYGKVLRYGAFAPEVLDKLLRWMNDVMAPSAGATALAESEGIDLRALVAEALHMGDEGHNRNKAGSLLFLRQLAPGDGQRRRRSRLQRGGQRSRVPGRERAERSQPRYGIV